MARTTITHITDDIDGSPDAEEVKFGFQGTEYTIDLSKKNRAAFEKAIKPYLQAATKTSSGSTSGRRRKATSSTRRDLQAIRTWARENNLEVSERGRISQSVIDQYEAANT